jgi:hypothetical protein
MKLVRIKPYDPRRKRVTRRYHVRGVLFREENGWYKVDDEFAEFLSKQSHDSADPEAPTIFDVCEPDEAEAIDFKEQQRNVRATAANAEVVTAKEAVAKPKEFEVKPAMIDPDPEGLEVENDDEAENVGRVSASSATRSKVITTNDVRQPAARKRR